MKWIAIFLVIGIIAYIGYSVLSQKIERTSFSSTGSSTMYNVNGLTSLLAPLGSLFNSITSGIKNLKNDD